MQKYEVVQKINGYSKTSIIRNNETGFEMDIGPTLFQNRIAHKIVDKWNKQTEGGCNG